MESSLVELYYLTFRRLRGERKKKLAALQSAKAITAWTKKIIVERSNLSHPDR